MWRGIERLDREVEQLIEASRKYDPQRTYVDDRYAVIFASEREVREILPESKDGEILVPEGTELVKGFDLGGRFLIGVDPPIAFADMAGRRNLAPGGAGFDRRRAEDLIGAQALCDFAAGGERRVNVVIVDGGLDADFLAAQGYAAGVKTLPGLAGSKTQTTRRESVRHANAMARNVLSLAPHARLVDAPILPDRIENTGLYASRVFDLVLRLAFEVLTRPDESWVALCAWGLIDRKYDGSFGSYADDRRHLLSTVVDLLVSLGVDVVFSSGNSGQFWPDPFSGHTDRGPHRSIMGANGLSSVLTVGAVDPSGLWIGESAQGPEPEGLRAPGNKGPRKPDVCAPSWFRESDDRHAVQTGTSAACAMAAGVVAAVRRRVAPDLLPPAALIDAIRATARREGYAGGDERDTPAQLRLGSGVIDAEALVASLDGFPRA